MAQICLNEIVKKFHKFLKAPLRSVHGLNSYKEGVEGCRVPARASSQFAVDQSSGDMGMAN